MRQLLRDALVLACAGFGWLVAGCGSDIKTLQAFLQEPRRPVSGTEYRILPPDVIGITSQTVSEINGIQRQVRPDGKVNLPLLGEVPVAGLTPKEVEKGIVAAALAFYAQADATVDVSQYRSQKFYVFGEVMKPGPMPYTGCDTLLDALCMAQPNRLAWPQRTKVVRGRPPSKGGYLPPDEGKPAKGSVPKKEGDAPPEAEVLTVNLMAMVKSGDLSHNVLLRPDDVIYVPPDPFSRIGLFLQKVLFPVRPVLEAVRVPTEVQGATATGQ